MSTVNKSIRLNFLVDPAFKKVLDQGAHDSWMSVGEYIREIIGLFGGASFDTASETVEIGKEVTLEGVEALRVCAARRGISVSDFCGLLLKPRKTGQVNLGDELIGENDQHPSPPDAVQVSLFS